MPAAEDQELPGPDLGHVGVEDGKWQGRSLKVPGRGQVVVKCTILGTD